MFARRGAFGSLQDQGLCDCDSLARYRNRTCASGLKDHSSTTKLIGHFYPGSTSVNPTLLRLSTHCQNPYLCQIRRAVEKLRNYRRVENFSLENPLVFPANAMRIHFRRLTGSLYSNRKNIHRSVVMNDY